MENIEKVTIDNKLSDRFWTFIGGTGYGFLYCGGGVASGLTGIVNAFYPSSQRVSELREDIGKIRRGCLKTSGYLYKQTFLPNGTEIDIPR